MGRDRVGPPRNVRNTLAGQFSQHLSGLVADSGMTVEEFALAIGKSKESVWRYFRGTIPPINLWLKMARVLRLKSVRELLPEIRTD